jgi:molybdenum cofactor cytidylyltransferase
MGKPKQLLEWQGDYLINHQLKLLSSVSKEVLCVLGANADQIGAVIDARISARITEFESWEEGMGSTISFGLRSLNVSTASTHVLISLVDQVQIDKDHLNAMWNLAQKFPDKIIATAYSNLEGVPAIFPRTFWDQLQDLKGDQGARKIIRNSEAIFQKIEMPYQDLDTPEDYQRLVSG